MYGTKVAKDEETDNDGRPFETNEEKPDLILARYALSRISGNIPRQDSSKMSLETVLVKLCLELIELVFSPFGSLEYRNALHTLPYTVRQAITLLKEMKTGNDNYAYIKWINNSAVQRDFRSILKNFGLLDRYGSKAEFPTPGFPGISQPSQPAPKVKRPASAGNNSNGKQNKNTSPSSTPVPVRSKNNGPS